MAKYPSKSSMVGMIALALVSSAALAAKPTGGTGGGGKNSGGGDTGTSPASIAINAEGNALVCTVTGSNLPPKYYANANCRGDSLTTVVATWGCEMPSGSWTDFDVTEGAMTPPPESVLTDRKGKATANLLWSLNSSANSDLQTRCKDSGGTWAVCSVSVNGVESWWTWLDGNRNTISTAKTAVNPVTLSRNGCTGT